jgi:hypothetical protein
LESLVSRERTADRLYIALSSLVLSHRVEKDGSEVELVDITPAMASVLAPKDERELVSDSMIPY